MNYLEVFGTLVGLAYLWLEYKASIYLWIASIIMPAIYIIVYYQAGLYADFGINIYYLIASVYGWIIWKKQQGQTDNIPQNTISCMPKSRWYPLVGITTLLFAAIAWILIRFTDSNVPYWDSFTTALSVAALWMLAHKYIEQWLVWIIVDVVCCGLYIYKELYFTAGLYGLYSIIALFGYIKWKQLMHTAQ
jgi:nicotinamide mononucleotide transporter